MNPSNPESDPDTPHPAQNPALDEEARSFTSKRRVWNAIASNHKKWKDAAKRWVESIQESKQNHEQADTENLGLVKSYEEGTTDISRSERDDVQNYTSRFQLETSSLQQQNVARNTVESTASLSSKIVTIETSHSPKDNKTLDSRLNTSSKASNIAVTITNEENSESCNDVFVPPHDLQTRPKRTWPILPMELLESIFTHLSAVCVIRFRALSKKYMEVFSSSTFQAKHLKRALEGKETNVVSFEQQDSKGCATLYIMDENRLTKTWLPKACCSFPRYEYVSASSSSCGIICFNDTNRRTFLVNPGVHGCWLVPEEDFFECRGTHCAFISYIGQINDFRIIKFCFLDDHSPVQCAMFSNLGNEWKLLATPQVILGRTPYSVSADYKVFWIAMIAGENVLLCLDMKTEKFEQLSLPEKTEWNIARNKYYDGALSEIRGSINVMQNQLYSVDIWELLNNKWNFVNVISHLVGRPLFLTEDYIFYEKQIIRSRHLKKGTDNPVDSGSRTLLSFSETLVQFDSMERVMLTWLN